MTAVRNWEAEHCSILELTRRRLLLLLENGHVLIALFFSWEQENEERQPSKGHFSGDQEMIRQIYGLWGEKEEMAALSCGVQPSGATFLKAACSKP